MRFAIKFDQYVLVDLLFYSKIFSATFSAHNAHNPLDCVGDLIAVCNQITDDHVLQDRAFLVVIFQLLVNIAGHLAARRDGT